MFIPPVNECFLFFFINVSGAPLLNAKYPTTHRVALSVVCLPLEGPHRTQQPALFTNWVPYIISLSPNKLFLTYFLRTRHSYGLHQLHFYFTPTLRFSPASKSHWLSNSINLPTTPLGLAPWAAAVPWNIYVCASLKHPCLHQVLSRSFVPRGRWERHEDERMRGRLEIDK